MSVSVSIVDNALAVGGRVQYTHRMLWKLKKSDSNTLPDNAPSAAPAPASPRAAPAERLGAAGATKVENTDVVAQHPAGSFVIPVSYRISGTVVTLRHVVVQGELEGPALVAPSVYVSNSGRLKAPTQAASVVVAGVVEQPVSARDVLEIRRGGALRSDVEAAVINIQPGGHISGARLAIGPLRSQE